MASLVHNYGFDLPEYSPDHITPRNQLSTTVKNGTIVREIAIHFYLLPYKLDHILGLADETFDTIADFCGASVVSHTWGIAKKPAENPLSSLSSFGIPGYSLVCEVDRISKSEMPDQASDTLRYALSRLHSEEQCSTNYAWVDAGEHQFMHGTTTHIQNHPRTYLIDIDIALVPREWLD